MIEMQLGVTGVGRTETLQLITRATDTYDENGDAVLGVENDPVDIEADVQPIPARTLLDLPEGVREKAEHLVWSKFEIQNDHVILYRGVRHRVHMIQSRRPYGFTRAVIGKLV